MGNIHSKLVVFTPNSAEEVTGDRNDIKRLCQQCLNRSAAKRLISKQEAMVMLGEMPFVLCTETIESISISNSKALRRSGDRSDNKTFLDEYKHRCQSLEDLSLYEFYHAKYNNEIEIKRNNGKPKIPHFVGVSGHAKFPVTDEYARATIIVYMPWRRYPRDLDWKTTFNAFIKSPKCPASCKLTYDREMKRHIDKMTGYDPRPHHVDHSRNAVADDDMDLLLLTGLRESSDMDSDALLLKSLPRGLEYKWDRKPMVSVSRNEKSFRHHALKMDLSQIKLLNNDNIFATDPRPPNRRSRRQPGRLAR